MDRRLVVAIVDWRVRGLWMEVRVEQNTDNVKPLDVEEDDDVCVAATYGTRRRHCELAFL